MWEAYPQGFKASNAVRFFRLASSAKTIYPYWSRPTTIPDERVADVELTQDVLSVALMDGRTITVPLAWYPRLFHATPAQRKNWRIAGGGYGIHWPEIDEDLNTEGLLRGAPAPRSSLKKYTLKSRTHRK